MELNETIAHCEEKAEELRKDVTLCRSPFPDTEGYIKNRLECAKEQEQLAEWLGELKQLRAENDGLKNQLDDLCENLAWYVNERNRLISEKQAENKKLKAMKRDVWDLYQRHQSHMATYVYEFGLELNELLNRYEKEAEK